MRPRFFYALPQRTDPFGGRPPEDAGIIHEALTSPRSICYDSNLILAAYRPSRDSSVGAFRCMFRIPAAGPVVPFTPFSTVVPVGPVSLSI